MESKARQHSKPAHKVQAGKTRRSDGAKVGGYSPEEVARAPFKPPAPDTGETTEDTSNRKVVVIFSAAAVTGLLGLVFMLMNLLIISVPLLIVSGAAIIVAVFAPIR